MLLGSFPLVGYLRLFPPRRVFASSKQLDQVAEIFCSRWAVRKTHPGKYIACHFGKSNNKKVLHDDVTKRRFTATSPKSSVQCPFHIAYSYNVNYTHNKSRQLPEIYYHVKTTCVNYTHTCGVDTLSYKEAKQRCGDIQPDLNGVQDIIAFLCNRPTMSLQVLWPFMVKYIPKYKGTSSQFMLNFRNWCLKFILENKMENMPTAQDSLKFQNVSDTTAEELLVDDSPLIRENFLIFWRR